MADCIAPQKEMAFLLNELMGVNSICDQLGNENIITDDVDVVLTEEGRLADQF